MHKFLLLPVGITVSLLAMSMSTAELLSAQADSTQADSALPDPVYHYDPGDNGRVFGYDGSSQNVAQSSMVRLEQKDVAALKVLTAGTIVIEFEVSAYKNGRAFCASNSKDKDNYIGFYFYPEGNWPRGFALYHNAKNIYTLDTPDQYTPPVQRRITAVMTVDRSGDAYLISSHADDKVQPGTGYGFFDSIKGLDNITIGGCVTKDARIGFDGTIYSVEIYDQPFSHDQAERRITDGKPVQPLPPPSPTTTAAPTTTLAAPTTTLPDSVALTDSSLAFEWTGTETGSNFDGTNAMPASQDQVDKVKGLSKGTIVVSFDSDLEKVREYPHTATQNKPVAIVSASDSSRGSSRFCFCVTDGVYGAYAHLDTVDNESGEAIVEVVNDLRSLNSAYGSARITAVLSVSDTDGSFLMTSQDLNRTQRDSSMTEFFDSVDNIDSLLIGGSENDAGTHWNFRGSIYFVEIWDRPFSEEEAREKIEETYLPIEGGISYIRTGDRRFQFDVDPPGLAGLDLSYQWTFPDDSLSAEASPLWEAPTGEADPFTGGIPKTVAVTVTVVTSGPHHGFAKTSQATIAPEAQTPLSHFQSWVFRHGEEGFDCFRIPAIVRIGNGDLLTFAEGRPQSQGIIDGKYHECADFQHGISIVMKRSIDDGATWGPLSIIARNVVPSTGREWAAQNVTAVLDTEDPDYPEGKVIIVYNKIEHSIFDTKGRRDTRTAMLVDGEGIRRTFAAWSGDHGHSWNHYKIDSPAGTHDGDITSQVHHPYNPAYTSVYDAEYASKNYNSSHTPRWSYSSPALGHSIQLKHGPDATKGRLIVTGMLGLTDSHWLEFDNYVYWSDDHGKTWQIGGVLDGGRYMLNEANSVELEDGSILINSRAYEQIKSRSIWENDRLVARRVMTRAVFDPAGVIRFRTPDHIDELHGVPVATGLGRITMRDQKVFGGKGRIAYTFPDNQEDRERIRMSLKMSLDEGRTWEGYGSTPKLLNPEQSYYSDIVALPDARVGILYEGSRTSEFLEGGIIFASATLRWLSSPDLGDDPASDQRALVHHDVSDVDFDGATVDDMSRFADEIDGLAEGSMVVTFKTDGNDVGQTLFFVSDSGDPDSWWSIAQDFAGVFGVVALKDGLIVNDTTVSQHLITDGRWHRLAVTVGKDGTDIYLDGQHVAGSHHSGFFDAVSDLDMVTVGGDAYRTTTGSHWTGAIGTVEVFDGLLTSEQAVAATQPPAIPVAVWRIDKTLGSAASDSAASNTDTGSDLVGEPLVMDTVPGGDVLVATLLPEWSCGNLASSWALGASFTVPDNVSRDGIVFRTGDGFTELRFGVWNHGNDDRIGLRLATLDAPPWNLTVDAGPYLGKDITATVVMSPERSYLVIDGEIAAETDRPVPPGGHDWDPSATSIGDSDSPIDTFVRSVAIWKGVVPSHRLATSLTLTGDVAR